VLINSDEMGWVVLCWWGGGGGSGVSGLKNPEKVGSGVKIFQPPLVSVLTLSCYWIPMCMGISTGRELNCQPYQWSKNLKYWELLHLIF